MTTAVSSATSRPAADQARSDTPYTRRARYFDSGNAFNIVYADVPAASFVVERDQALDSATGTKLIHCDQSAALGLSFPATSPLVLASYARIRAGDSLQFEPRASVVLGYVISGAGRAVQGSDEIAWSQGDVFSFPGGRAIQLSGRSEDSVLWLVTNQPELDFERVLPSAPEDGLVEVAHFPSATIAEQLVRARARLVGSLAAGLAVVFSSEKLEERRNISPTLTLAMNQLGAGEDQTPHSHNSVAVSLAISDDRCYSMVDGKRKDWERFVTLVTPPASVHSHHNRGAAAANWLIVQDGGIHYHCRTMGFKFEDVQHR
jgi:gentisate 1,2-dioxygenase